MLISKLMSSIFSWANALGAYKFILESGFCPRLCSFSKKRSFHLSPVLFKLRSTCALSKQTYLCHISYFWMQLQKRQTCFETRNSRVHLIQLNSSQLITYMIALISQASLDSCCVKPTINLGWTMRSVYRRQQSKLLAAKKKLQVLSPHERTYLVIVLQNYLELEL